MVENIDSVEDGEVVEMIATIDEYVPTCPIMIFLPLISQQPLTLPSPIPFPQEPPINPPPKINPMNDIVSITTMEKIHVTPLPTEEDERQNRQKERRKIKERK